MESKIESVAKIVAESSSNTHVEPSESGPSRQEKGKDAARIASFATEVDGKEDQNDGNNDNDDEFGIDNGDDYVSHSMYRDIIAESFDKRSPSRMA